MMVVVKLRHFIVGVLFVALAVASVWSVSANARWALMLGRGRLTLAASRSTPLFRLTSLRPGSRAASEITVRNTGTLDAVWELRAVSRGDARLLRRLRLRVYEQAAATSRICVYAGSVAALRRVALGVLPAGEARAFVFVASWPRVGSDAGGALIGAGSADVDFSWYATDARLVRADRLPARPSEPRLERVPGLLAEQVDRARDPLHRARASIAASIVPVRASSRGPRPYGPPAHARPLNACS